jgi:hypothetical protein
MLFLQYDLLFVTFFIVRCMAFSTINAYDVFVILSRFTGFTVMLHGWMIFCTKAISRLFLANKACMTVMLTVRIPTSKLRFFKISRIIRNFTNEKFTPKRPLMHFFIIEK